MSANSALFPHQKLDWLVNKLEEKVRDLPDDPAARVDLARAVLGRGLYHGGGERDCNAALTVARKCLTEDPANPEALVLAGLALLGMDRNTAASRYLDQAVRIDGERADLRLAMGLMLRAQNDDGAAIRQLETACRLAPDAWETHLELGRTLLELARRQDEARRLVERAQFHLVQALRRGPSPDQLAPLLKELGVTCLMTRRFREAEKFFIRLREHEKHANTARYFLGLVAYELGKYNNAVQHFRGYLRSKPDDARVLARVAMAWFHLGEFPRAREACNQALLVDPTNVEARHALGCTLLEEGEPNEALRVFREALKERPDHMPTYIELARTRRLGGDLRWLEQALEAEVRGYDRLSPGAMSDARTVSRSRVAAVLLELAHVGPEAAQAVLHSIHLTQNEALRFQLWEAACEMALRAVADHACERLREPGVHYGPGLGGVALSAAEAVPEQYLTTGLGIDETDLKRATVDRHGPAHDVQGHRKNLDKERQRARAHQALLLLSIGVRRSAAGKELLRQWADTADADLALAANAALAMYGDPAGARALQERAVEKGAMPVVEQLLAEVTPPSGPRIAQKVEGRSTLRCSTCGRGQTEVSHMIAGGDTVICDRCVVHITQNRATLSAPDQAACSLCGRSHFESAGLYRYNNIEICNHCIQQSLGLTEREEVDSFLAAW
ncbi:MAG: tetratricopeptide repeat protein [Myxococcota bacterium]|nr:tetratricopeptide repeat protein [Myxococcota bacterium]